MRRDFDVWLASFRDSIASYQYYIDFDKIYRNIADVKVELNILNSLIGSKQIEADFEKIVTRYTETLKCIPILLAVRSNEIYAMDEDGAFTYHFKKMSDTIEQYKTFMRKTGLFQLMQNHHIRNLLDYVTGVETGLDSNGRKNRGGHLMEDLVEKFIQKAGFRRDETYFKEMTITKIHQKWGIDLSAISNDGKAEKRFDYVIKMPDQLYVIETNFYTSGGSKLNETARSYKTIANEVKTIRGVTFLWFTDGKGWRSARGNWSPYIPRNLLLRYSKEGDWVLDQFAGGGTTLVEAKLLHRNCIGLDVNPAALSRCHEKCDFPFENAGKIIIREGDARHLDFLPDASIDFICTHPPYADIIRYSEDLAGDLSHLRGEAFLAEMEKVAGESYRVLKKDKFCAVLMGDMRQKGCMIPLSFQVMERFLAAGFTLKELIVKTQHNCRATGFWKTNSVKYNFLLIAHEHLFVFRK